MRQRVIIAVAIAAKPRLIIADEPTTALDVTIQAQILDLMKNLVRAEGASLILISHDLAVVSRMTERIVVMYCGKIVEQGATRDVLSRPLHPYTRGLLDSIPRLGKERKRLYQIPGMVPNAFELPSGCSFAPRCSRARPECLAEEPAITRMEGGRSAACRFPLADEGTLK